MIECRLQLVYDRKNNFFDELRFILATMVIYVHSFALLYGEGKIEPFTRVSNYQLGLGSLAVYCFFILSGFFMIQSLESNNSLLHYARNRILRILPAFYISLLISLVIYVFITGGFVFAFFDGSPLNFIFKAMTFHLFGYAWTISNLYPNNPLVDAVNGSMWTLKHEIALYALLPMIIFIMHNKRILLAVFYFSVLILAISNISSNFLLINIPCCAAWVFSVNELQSFTVFSSYFFAGTILFKFREKILVSKRIVLSCLAFIILGVFFGNLKLILLLVLPYFIIVIGSILRLKLFSRFGDYSYGMYIYAFPVQQTLVHYYGHMFNVTTFFATSFIVTLFLSIISWHCFEKKILSFKKKE